MNPKKGGGPKNMVYDSSVGKGMTMKQYAKHIKDQSISKSEVIKRGILTKTELEKAIREGRIRTVQIGAIQYIIKVSVYEFFNQQSQS